MTRLSKYKSAFAQAALLVMCMIIGLAHALNITADDKELELIETKHTTVFLVRHAEKEHNGKDPELSVAGKERAQSLMNTLLKAEIEFIHSSDYIRTRDTAAPLASRLRIETEIYDPRNLPAIAEKIKEKGGVHLVVGHSNTTPSLVNLLGGEATDDIDEAVEYDRLYTVNIASNGDVTTSLRRY